MHKYKKIIIGTTVLFFIVVIYVLFFNNSQLEIIFFDIGQGDSILIEAPHNFQILIDGGPDDTVVEKLGQYMPFYDRTIELVVLTHPHADHVNGLVEVVNRYNIKHILQTNIEADTSAYQRWRELIKQKNIPNTIAQRGQVFSIPQAGTLTIIYPFKLLAGQTITDLNAASVVIKLEINNKSFLFMGDLPGEQETEILDHQIDVSADLIKVGHHGSSESSGDNFIKAVDPDLAIIQVGENNSFGHPGKRVLELFKILEIKVLRNDELGDIKIEIKDSSLIEKFEK